MGTWETGLYDNDISLDVRDDYIAKLKSGKTDDEALEEILSEYEEEAEDIDCKYDFYIALADTMWKKGRLTEKIKVKALEMIDEDKVSERWQSERIRKERVKKLDKIKEKINSPMPERKKISIHKPYVLGWEQGDVYTFTITEIIKGFEKYVGWHALFYVDEIYLKDWQVRGINDELAYLYFFLMEKNPENANDIKGAKIVCFYRKGSEFRYKTYICERSKKSRPKDFRYLGKFNEFQPPENETKGERIMFWDRIAQRDILYGYEEQLRYEEEI